jgi:phosphoglycolate phosphatase
MTITNPAAVLFDLDGTLIDSRGDIAAACNYGLIQVGRAPLEERIIAGFVGDGARVLMSRALELEPEHALVERGLEAFHVYYEQHPVDHTKLLPGVIELFDALGDRPLALVTNKPRGATMGVLAGLSILDRFASVRTGSDGPLKPDPRAILDAVRPMRAAPKDIWMVGDGEQDVKAGKAAGCQTVGVLGGFQGDAKLVASEPDALVSSLHELADWVRRIGDG